ncbi:MAG TPA: alkaline phosphatase family protein [Verrucomicrobiae bacterium]|nr:alkaline phosphatase family protein [Verrucomicrobiae bacterium]
MNPIKSFLLLAALLAGGWPLLATESPRAQHVFIISFDQGNPDLIQQADMPTFHQMAAEGARTWNAYTIVPSLTLPAHTSMLTGVGPQVHQILWNDYLPARGVVKIPTIFSLARQQGLVTAMFVGKEKFKHLVLPGSVDVFVWPQPDDDAKAVAKAFAGEVGTLKPNLCFIHFRDPDTVGHQYGSHSPEKLQALADCDAALKTIKDAIAAAGLTNSVIILTADHGSHDVPDRSGRMTGTHGSAETADVTIPWVVWGTGVKKNFAITAPVVEYDTAATALWLLGVPLPESFWGRPVTSAFEASTPKKSDS